MSRDSRGVLDCQSYRNVLGMHRSRWITSPILTESHRTGSPPPPGPTNADAAGTEFGSRGSLKVTFMVVAAVACRPQIAWAGRLRPRGRTGGLVRGYSSFARVVVEDHPHLEVFVHVVGGRRVRGADRADVGLVRTVHPDPLVLVGGARDAVGGVRDAGDVGAHLHAVLRRFDAQNHRDRVVAPGQAGGPLVLIAYGRFALSGVA